MTSLDTRNGVTMKVDLH